jgi:Gluconate 2-dehydrogenase subunit 3
MKLEVTRRGFLKAASVGIIAANLPALLWRQWLVGEAQADSRPRFFTEPQDFATLQALVDRLIPPDTDPLTRLASPGAAAAGVADYIDFLLGAFLGSAPFIFAGGPFSNRNPFDGQGLTDDMVRPMSLTPNQRLAWRIRILGTQKAPESTADQPKISIVKANNILAAVVNGPTPGIDPTTGDVAGFQQQYNVGIAALRAQHFTELTTAQQDALIAALAIAQDPFILLVQSHAAEGMYGNPEYGGNQPLDRSLPASGADGTNRPLGWTIAFFEGDRQPLGYTTFDLDTQTSVEEPNHPVSTPNPGDPTFL